MKSKCYKLTPEEIELIKSAPIIPNRCDTEARREWYDKYKMIADNDYLWVLYAKYKRFCAIDQQMIELRNERIPLFQELLDAGIIQMKTWDELDEEEGRRT